LPPGSLAKESLAKESLAKSTAVEEPEGQARSWEELLDELGRRLGEVLDELDRTVPAPPLGRWLDQDLIRLACQSCGEVISQAALRAGLAETTFRRRLAKLEDVDVGASRCRGWGPVATVLERVVAANRGRHLPVAEACQVSLLAEIVVRFPGRVGYSAALLGVSAPTFRRRLRAFEQAK
jgi:transcriptional regulator of acetoin/glycerol metabolism